MTRTTKTAALMSVAVGVLALVASTPAAADQLVTVSFTGASWNDGGSLNGYFTVDEVSSTDFTLMSAYVVTGNGTSDGFPGQTYIYDVSGQMNTVADGYEGFDAYQASGAPANEVYMSDSSGLIFLDWQTGTSDLWVGNADGQYSSESILADRERLDTRSLNSEGGSAGTETPEPSSLLLLGTGLVGCLGVLRRKIAR